MARETDMKQLRDELVDACTWGECYRARWMREKWARVSELVDGQAPREQG
jgi:hypothetical protein